jgi:protein-S-isoprenylcysteine O-methyltransferase Ste14
MEALWLGSIGLIFLYPLAVIVAPSVLLSGFWAIHFPDSETVQFVGFGFIMLGGALVGWAFRSLGRFATVEIQVLKDHEIVRSGPYARIRHPVYTGNLLVSLGITLTFLSVFLWIPLLVALLVARWRALTEERLFLSIPGLAKEYASYVQRSGRFLPFVISRCRNRA